MKRFLFAADFSKANQNAFQYTKELISGHDIALDLVNVYDAPFAYSSEIPERALLGYLSELENSSKNRMKDMMSELPSGNRGNIYAIRGIYASIEIAECAEKIEPELIVMSLREDYGILRRLIGNTTARTVHKTTYPVMAIPAHAKYQKIENVLFPTTMTVDVDLQERETVAIKWLSDFAGFLKHPDIELLHVLDDEKTDSLDISVMGEPFHNLKLTYSHAYTVEEGIMRYMEKKKPNLLAFYKPLRSFWERLYHYSKSKNL